MQLNFQHTLGLERRLIALDNAAIELGRAERDAFRVLARAETKLHLMDKAHHVLHACARVPLTQPKCLPLDQVSEQGMALLRNGAWAAAVARWNDGAVKAMAQAKRLSSKVVWRRSAAPPVSPERCVRCGQVIGWKRQSGHTLVRLLDHSGHAALRVSLLPAKESAWHYQLREDTHGWHQ